MPLKLYYQSGGERRKGGRRVEGRERGMEKKRRMFVLGYDFMSPSISTIIEEINTQRLGNYKEYKSVHSKGTVTITKQH